jgi:hypothetical protein
MFTFCENFDAKILFYLIKIKFQRKNKPKRKMAADCRFQPRPTPTTAAGLFTRDRLAEIWGNNDENDANEHFHRHKNILEEDEIRSFDPLICSMKATNNLNKEQSVLAQYFFDGPTTKKCSLESATMDSSEGSSPKSTSMLPRQSRLYSCWSNNSSQQEEEKMAAVAGANSNGNVGGGQAWENVWDWVQSSTAQQQQQAKLAMAQNKSSMKVGAKIGLVGKY